MLSPTEDGITWRFPASLAPEELEAAERHEHVEGLSHFAKLRIDVVVPHMFCLPGLTTFRALFDVRPRPRRNGGGGVTRRAGIQKLCSRRPFRPRRFHFRPTVCFCNALSPPHDFLALANIPPPAMAGSGHSLPGLRRRGAVAGLEQGHRTQCGQGRR